MGEREHKPILVQLRDNHRYWHITIHANGSHGFSRGFHEAVERHRRYYQSFPDFDGVCFLVGILTATGSKWDYDWFRWRRCLTGSDGANEVFRVWGRLVGYEQQCALHRNPRRAKVVHKHVARMQAQGSYINAVVPELGVGDGASPLAGWFY